ncbi:uncharacterized protein BDV14DRAFT_197515 [Aspergillus stella-maris]|uniref:uncharacterized protein n=1 Tax=Aspergillus stella-maris TaxID=1810926 RepID=UPI003CCD7DA6
MAQASNVPTGGQTLIRRAGDELANGALLKVLPLGDSITLGTGGAQKNGYRAPLHDLLETYNNTIDFVGSQSDGTMADNQHEGHGGLTIEQITNSSAVGIYAQPNIVLLHAGTNNMKTDSDSQNAPDDLRELIDYVYESWEGTMVFLAKIIPSKTEEFEPRIEEFNEAVEEISDGYKDEHEMILVDMYSAFMGIDGWKDELMADDLHPNHEGYDIMARTWFDAILQASDEGKISEPGPGKTPPTETGWESCRESPAWYNWGQIATGPSIAISDGPLKPAWGPNKIVKAGECDRDWVRFLDIDGDGLKDYTCVDPNDGSMKVWKNDYKASGTWKELGTVADGDEGRDGKRVMFADINGDGRDDYIYLNPQSGNIEACINKLQNEDDEDGKWQWKSIGVISEGHDLNPSQLRMGDNFLVVDENTGAVTAWLNTGAKDVPDYYKLGQTASGKTVTENDKVAFADLTGNGRVDYILIGESGKAVGFVNRLQEKTLLPRWLEPVTLREGLDGEDVEQEAIHFADITGDVDGDGVTDYFWINENGQGWGFLDRGNGAEDNWLPRGNIARGNHSREEIRMAVLTDSKRADYVVVNKETGKASWYENLGPDSNDEYQFAERGYIADGPAGTIEKTFGMRWNAKNVRFADLDNDGLDDYIYVDDQGATIWWRFNGANEDPILAAPIKVADGVGVRANQVWFADTDGDMLLDYVVIDSITGAATTYRNLGFRGENATDGATGSIRWGKPRSFADGVAGDEPVGKVPGRSVRLAEMTGDDRWDYLVVDPDQGALLHWQNRCANDSSDSNDQDQLNDQDPPESGAVRLMDGSFSSLLIYFSMAASIAISFLELRLHV